VKGFPEEPTAGKERNSAHTLSLMIIFTPAVLLAELSIS